MQQSTFAEVSFEQYRKPTRRERFLDEMNRRRAVGGPGRCDCAGLSQARGGWASACRRRAHVAHPLSATVVQPVGSGGGRGAVRLARDAAVLWALIWAASRCPMRRRSAVSPPVGSPPGGERLLCARISGSIWLRRDCRSAEGPSWMPPLSVHPVRRRIWARRSEIRRCIRRRKGNQWYFGMKAHIGVDSRTKLIHSVAATAANVHDSQVLPDLLHGQETRVWGTPPTADNAT